MSTETETISPIDYAYRLRSKAKKGLDQAKEAGAPKPLISAFAQAHKLAQDYLDTLTGEDSEETSEPAPVAPKPPTKRIKANPEADALKLEIARMKRENASLKAEETSVQAAVSNGAVKVNHIEAR